LRKQRGLQIIIILVCLFLLLSLGCKEKSKNTVLNKKQSLSETELKEVLLKGHAEKIGLLSIKYGIEQSTTGQILDYYLSKHDFLFSSLSDKKDSKQPLKVDMYGVDTDIQKTIKELSIKYNIPEQKLASLITDYRIWGACEDSQGASPTD
jgi:hypothetical protein